MSCSYAHFPEDSLFSKSPSVQAAKETCELSKKAAAFLGFRDWQINAFCESAKTVVGCRLLHGPHGYKGRGKVGSFQDLLLYSAGYDRVVTVRYSKAVRCPVLAAVIAAGAAFPVSGEIEEKGVYTVGMAARLLDMNTSAVRRLVRSGELEGRRDAGGYLITGAALLAFLGGGVAVLGEGRQGAIRPDSGEMG